MNLLFIDRNAKVGGGTTYLRTLVPEIRKLGHCCYLLSGAGPCTPELRDLTDGLVGHPPVGWLARRAIARAIARWRIDVVITQTTTCARHAVAPCRQAGVPLIMNIHSRCDMSEAREATDYAGRIVVMNEGTARHVRAQVPGRPDRVHLSILPVDPDRFPAAPPRDEPGFAVAHCGRISHTKGRHVIASLRAAHELVEDIPGLSLTIVGGTGGRLRDIRKRLTALNTACGRPIASAPGQAMDPRPHLIGADLVIGAGYVALEALSMNRRVVGVGFAGLFGEVTPENFEDAVAANFGDTGATIEDVSAEATAAAIRQAYANHQSLGQIDWGSARVSGACAPSRIARELTALYEGCLAGVSAAR